ncbi:nucleotidyltransferase domain-containing protein [Tabrizicola sp.]|uniref:nucleotidyltransferase domain-containing protein n=1 Tax=Tabrizicola sp. TaxID=2005166 RepID=UPI003F3842CB
MMPLPENAWDAWSPDELSARLGRSTADWYVAGGWALDLWHGHQTRAHDDLEFAVRPEQIESCRKSLSELEFFIASAGTLTHLPSTVTVPADTWQLWGADLAAGRWRVDMMLERGTPEFWAYKRDPLIRLPRAAAIRRSAAGISYLAPSIVLLFKAKYHREKDERDFQAALPKLQSNEKADLRRWLEQLHPGHDWIAMLR